MRVETSNTEHFQFNTLSCYKSLSLIKLHHHFSSISLSYAAFSFNSMYEPLTLSIDSNISESKVSGVDNKVSAYFDKVVSEFQLPTQFI